MNLLDNKTQRSRGKASRLTPQKLDADEKSQCQHDLRNKETPEKTNTAKSSGQMDQQRGEKDKKDAEGLDMTSEMYLCCCQQPPASPLLESPLKKEEEEVASKCLAQRYDDSWKHDSLNVNLQVLIVEILLQSHHGGRILWIPWRKLMLLTSLR